MDWLTLNGRFNIAREICRMENNGENVDELKETLDEANATYGDPEIYVFDFGNKNVALYTSYFISDSDAWSEFCKSNRQLYVCTSRCCHTFFKNGIEVKGFPQPYRKTLEKYRVFETTDGNLWFIGM